MLKGRKGSEGRAVKEGEGRKGSEGKAVKEGQ
jgi:hypothetical protein